MASHNEFGSCGAEEKKKLVTFTQLDSVTGNQIKSLFETVVKNSYLDSNYDSQFWDMESVTVITNEELEERYRQKWNELAESATSHGVKSCVLFSCYRNDTSIHEIGINGLSIKQHIDPTKSLHILGDNMRGILLCQRADIQLKTAESRQRDRCWLHLFVCACSHVGRIDCCSISGQKGRPPIEECDCHISSIRSSFTDDILMQAIRSQVYFFDKEKDNQFSSRPRQILPLGYVVYRKKSSANDIPTVVSHMEIKIANGHGSGGRRADGLEEIVDLTTTDDNECVPVQTSHSTESFDRIKSHLVNVASADVIYNQSVYYPLPIVHNPAPPLPQNIISSFSSMSTSPAATFRKIAIDKRPQEMPAAASSPSFTPASVALSLPTAADAAPEYLTSRNRLRCVLNTFISESSSRTEEQFRIPRKPTPQQATGAVFPNAASQAQLTNITSSLRQPSVILQQIAHKMIEPPAVNNSIYSGTKSANAAQTQLTNRPFVVGTTWNSLRQPSMILQQSAPRMLKPSTVTNTKSGNTAASVFGMPVRFTGGVAQFSVCSSNADTTIIQPFAVRMPLSTTSSRHPVQHIPSSYGGYVAGASPTSVRPLLLKPPGSTALFSLGYVDPGQRQPLHVRLVAPPAESIPSGAQAPAAVVSFASDAALRKDYVSLLNQQAVPFLMTAPVVGNPYNPQMNDGIRAPIGLGGLGNDFLNGNGLEENISMTEQEDHFYSNVQPIVIMPEGCGDEDEKTEMKTADLSMISETTCIKLEVKQKKNRSNHTIILDADIGMESLEEQTNINTGPSMQREEQDAVEDFLDGDLCISDVVSLQKDVSTMINCSNSCEVSQTLNSGNSFTNFFSGNVFTTAGISQPSLQMNMTEVHDDKNVMMLSSNTNSQMQVVIGHVSPVVSEKTPDITTRVNMPLCSQSPLSPVQLHPAEIRLGTYKRTENEQQQKIKQVQQPEKQQVQQPEKQQCLKQSSDVGTASLEAVEINTDSSVRKTNVHGSSSKRCEMPAKRQNRMKRNKSIKHPMNDLTNGTSEDTVLKQITRTSPATKYSKTTSVIDAGVKHIPVLRVCEDGSIELHLEVVKDAQEKERKEKMEMDGESEINSTDFQAKVELMKEIPDRDSLMKSLSGLLGNIYVTDIRSDHSEIVHIDKDPKKNIVDMSENVPVSLKDVEHETEIKHCDLNADHFLNDSSNSDMDLMIANVFSIDPNKFDEINQVAVDERRDQNMTADDEMDQSACDGQSRERNAPVNIEIKNVVISNKQPFLMISERSDSINVLNKADAKESGKNEDREQCLSVVEEPEDTTRGIKPPLKMAEQFEDIMMTEDNIRFIATEEFVKTRTNTVQYPDIEMARASAISGAENTSHDGHPMSSVLSEPVGLVESDGSCELSSLNIAKAVIEECEVNIRERKSPLSMTEQLEEVMTGDERLLSTAEEFRKKRTNEVQPPAVEITRDSNKSDGSSSVTTNMENTSHDGHLLPPVSVSSESVDFVKSDGSSELPSVNSTSTVLPGKESLSNLINPTSCNKLVASACYLEPVSPVCEVGPILLPCQPLQVSLASYIEPISPVSCVESIFCANLTEPISPASCYESALNRKATVCANEPILPVTEPISPAFVNEPILPVTEPISPASVNEPILPVTEPISPAFVNEPILLACDIEPVTPDYPNMPLTEYITPPLPSSLPPSPSPPLTPLTPSVLPGPSSSASCFLSPNYDADLVPGCSVDGLKLTLNTSDYSDASLGHNSHSLLADGAEREKCGRSLLPVKSNQDVTGFRNLSQSSSFPSGNGSALEPTDLSVDFGEGSGFEQGLIESVVESTLQLPETAVDFAELEPGDNIQKINFNERKLLCKTLPDNFKQKTAAENERHQQKPEDTSNGKAKCMTVTMGGDGRIMENKRNGVVEEERNQEKLENEKIGEWNRRLTNVCRIGKMTKNGKQTNAVSEVEENRNTVEEEVAFQMKEERKEQRNRESEQENKNNAEVCSEKLTEVVCMDKENAAFDDWEEMGDLVIVGNRLNEIMDDGKESGELTSDSSEDEFQDLVLDETCEGDQIENEVRQGGNNEQEDIWYLLDNALTVSDNCEPKIDKSHDLQQEKKSSKWKKRPILIKLNSESSFMENKTYEKNNREQEEAQETHEKNIAECSETQPNNCTENEGTCIKGKKEIHQIMTKEIISHEGVKHRNNVAVYNYKEKHKTHQKSEIEQEGAQEALEKINREQDETFETNNTKNKGICRKEKKEIYETVTKEIVSYEGNNVGINNCKEEQNTFAVAKIQHKHHKKQKSPAFAEEQHRNCYQRAKVWSGTSVKRKNGSGEMNDSVELLCRKKKIWQDSNNSHSEYSTSIIFNGIDQQEQQSNDLSVQPGNFGYNPNLKDFPETLYGSELTSKYGHPDLFVFWHIKELEHLPMRSQQPYRTVVNKRLTETGQYVKNEHVFGSMTEMLTDEQRQHILESNISPLVAREVHLENIMRTVMSELRDLGLCDDDRSVKPVLWHHNLLMLTKEMLYDEMNEVKCYQKSKTVYVLPKDFCLSRESGKYISVEGIPLFISRCTLSLRRCRQLYCLRIEIEDAEEEFKECPNDRYDAKIKICRRLGVLHVKRRNCLAGICCTSTGQLNALMRKFKEDLTWYSWMKDLLESKEHSENSDNITLVNCVVQRIKNMEEYIMVMKDMKKDDAIWERCKDGTKFKD